MYGLDGGGRQREISDQSVLGYQKSCSFTAITRIIEGHQIQCVQKIVPVIQEVHVAWSI